MAGSVVSDVGGRCFVPRFPFVDGAEYEVTVDGVEAGVLRTPQPDRPVTARVVSIHPASESVPVNLLRFYVLFSHAMSEGSAASRIRLVDESSRVIPGALLKNDYELWDAAHRRLTLLLDPGRIKRGLADHQASGYPLRPGHRFTLVIDADLMDASGAPMVSSAERLYRVGNAEYRAPAPASWSVTRPREEAPTLSGCSSIGRWTAHWLGDASP